jgi:hypothetical protein
MPILNELVDTDSEHEDLHVIKARLLFKVTIFTKE